MGTKEKEKMEMNVAEGIIGRDLERLIPISTTPCIPDHPLLPAPAATLLNGGSELPSPSSSSQRHSGKEAIIKVIRSWATKKFMTGCVILFPIAITFYATWWFVHFVDGFFSPIYSHLGINTIGLGFVTSIAFIFMVGVFMSSWLGTSLLALGEWFIKKLPLMSYIYAASKQISSAISPDQNSRVFKEVAIIRHPRIGEYAFGFITATVILHQISGVEELCCVYVPTNHLYLGDIFLVNSKEIIRPNISVSEGIEIVISGGMAIPQMMSIMDAQVEGYGSKYSAVPAYNLTVDSLQLLTGGQLQRNIMLKQKLEIPRYSVGHIKNVYNQPVLFQTYYTQLIVISFGELS